MGALSWVEIRAGLILLAMTFLLLPILPDRPIDPWGAVNPSEIWLFAILMAAVSFAGYWAVKLVGDRAGIAADLEMVYNYFPRLRERRTSQAGYTSGGEQQMCAIGRALMSRPKMILLDEPSMGLAPQLVEQIFEIVKTINEQEGVTILLAEQNTNIALKYARYGYILESGRVVMEGSADMLRNNEDVKEFYLGLGGEGRKSFRDVKQYRRRKRWLG